MICNRPHYLLFSEASSLEAAAASPSEDCANQLCDSRWRFVLEHVSTDTRFSASDVEQNACAERLELLAVVRGLEAIDGPARVTLVTKSRYVSRGLKRGLAEWRSNGWRWERFGKLTSVRDADLWQRVDQALKFHELDCRLWQFGASSPKTAFHGGVEHGADRWSAADVAAAPIRRRTGQPGPRRRQSGGLVDAARSRIRRAAATITAGQGPALAAG